MINSLLVENQIEWAINQWVLSKSEPKVFQAFKCNTWKKRLIIQDTYNSLEDNICLGITALVNNSRTINQENPLSECDVLPDLSLPWNWSDLTNLDKRQREQTCEQ